MGAVPKKKPSKTRTHHRRSAWANEFSLPNLSLCPDCGEPRLSHRVCPHCGKYKGRQITEPKTKVKKIK